LKRVNTRNIRNLANEVRRTAAWSIKPFGRSTAGGPPVSKTRILPRSIRYGLEQDGTAAVIGAEHQQPHQAEQLEFGGRGKFKTGRGQRSEIKSVFIEPHPFMGPALEKEAPRGLAFWKNSL
jgi:hypothetical protein